MLIPPPGRHPLFCRLQRDTMPTPAQRLRSIGQRDCRRGRHDCRRNATGCDRPSIPEAQVAKSGGGGCFLQSVAFCRISSAVFVSFAPANHQRTARTGVCVRGRCRSGRDHPAPRTQCPHPGPLQREKGSGTPRDFSATLEMTWPHQPPHPAPPCALARTWTPAFAGVTGAAPRPTAAGSPSSLYLDMEGGADRFILGLCKTVG